MVDASVGVGVIGYWRPWDTGVWSLAVVMLIISVITVSSHGQCKVLLGETDRRKRRLFQGMREETMLQMKTQNMVTVFWSERQRRLGLL